MASLYSDARIYTILQLVAVVRMELSLNEELSGLLVMKLNDISYFSAVNLVLILPSNDNIMTI